MLSTYQTPKQASQQLPAKSKRRVAYKRLVKAVSGKRIKVLIVESEGWMKAGMELNLPEAEAMKLIKGFKAKAVR